jgi:hypothetical protein
MTETTEIFMFNKARASSILSSDLTIPIILALLQFALQTLFHGNYGYFRDELYYIACSNHLAFGYVDQPPLSIAILWVSRMLLGDSLYAIRFLPSVAGACVVVLAALMARKLGGGKLAQGLAALSVVAAHVLFGQGQFFTMNSFDVLFWALAGYVVVQILTEDRPKLWVLFGLFVGLGLENKYSMGFMVIGLVVGLILTRQRKHLATKWFWLGAVVASLVFLPHVTWEITHGFPSLEFMHNASTLKNINLGPTSFLLAQIRDLNVFNAPIWLGGIYFFFKHQEGRYRPLAWMYPVVFIVMVVGSAKPYYLSAIYPIFLAGGSVVFERFIHEKSLNWLKPVYASCLVILAVALLPFCLPVLPVQQFIKYEHFLGLMPRADERSDVGELPQYYADQFGWPEMVDSIATVYRKLTPEEQAQCVIFVRNYGEAGAVDFFGGKYGLPNALCGHNSYWFWGPGDRTGDIAIVVGRSKDLQDNLSDLGRAFKHVELGATTNAKYCMPYENGRMIFICKGLNTTVQKIWLRERFYI